MSSDRLAEGLKTGNAGGPQTWNFKDLQTPYANTTVFRPLAAGNWSSEFHGANMIASTPDNSEAYYRKTGTTMELLGYYGLDPLGIGIKGLCRFKPARIDRRAPLRFLDRYDYTFEMIMELSVDDLLPSFLDSIPITPDSIRIRVSTKRQELAEAYGTFQLPGNVYQVLRVKYTDQMVISLDAKLPFIDWQDVTGMLPDNEYFGERTETNFYFYSNQAKEPIAIMGATGRNNIDVTHIEFKAPFEIAEAKQGLIPGQPGVLAYPNPAIEKARFDFVNLDPGTYKLVLYNILGVQVWQEELWISGSKTLKVDLTKFTKGTYLYSLIDEKGKSLSTKRLMIIRP